MLDIKILTFDDTSQLTHLEGEWQSLCGDIGMEAQADKLFLNIKKHYIKAQRTYHNLSHIYALLKISERYKSEIEDYTVFRLAVWYHDIIYRATRKNNEAKSAEYALKVLAESNLSPLQLDALKTLIISTKEHNPFLPFVDDYLLLDADLAILATPHDTYTQYASAIREEYRIYPDFLYKKGRKKVLRHFLERPQIYFTNLFQISHEATARANLEWELCEY